MSEPSTNFLSSIDTTGMSNEPGQNEISFRTNAYSGFLRTMMASLSTSAVPEDPNWTPANTPGDALTVRPLANLTTRQSSDPTIALLDAWACAGDVLTFYQERIANEVYLRTALQSRSLVELSRLVGYAPRPGVAAGVYLSFTVNNGASLTINAGTAVQSVPAPDDVSQVPQTFETSEDLDASSDLNEFKPLMTQPLIYSDLIDSTAPADPPDPKDKQPAVTYKNKPITIAGLTNSLHEGDILFVNGGDDQQTAFRITHVKLLKADAAYGDRTVVCVQNLEFSSPPDPDATKRAALLKARKEEYSSANLLQKLRYRTTDFARRTKEWFSPPRPSPNSGPVAFREFVEPSPPAKLAASPKVANLDVALSSVQNNSTRAVLPPLNIAEAFNSPDAQEAKPSEQAAKEDAGKAKPEMLLLPVAGDGGKPDTSAPLRSVNEPQLQLLEEMSGGTPLQALQSVRASLADDASTDSSTTPDQSPVTLYVFRQQAGPFGKDAPLVATAQRRGPVTFSDWDSEQFQAAVDNDPKRLILNKTYPGILPGSWVMIVTPTVNKSDPAATPPAPQAVFLQVNGVAERTATGLGTTASVTELQFEKPWLNADADPDFDYTLVRQINVWVCSEKLDSSVAPIDDDTLSFTDDGQTTLECKLDNVYRGLEIGKPVILTGEIKKVPGTIVTDVYTVTSANHFPSEKPPYTSVTLQRSAGAMAPAPPAAQSPAAPQTPAKTTAQSPTQIPAQSPAPPTDPNAPDRIYKRSTVRLFGNIVSATHGETQHEVLGSGDSSAALQTFTLKATPLTYVSAANQLGLQSTLNVYVNDIRWHEATSGLSDAKSNDHVYMVRIDKTDSGSSKTSIIFGDGINGAAPPTGRENIRAVYRTGIGTAGNVLAGRITLLKQRPQGLKGVKNFLDASGGADPEAPDSVRLNAPIGARALGRLVSCDDYEDFARTFAGVTKAKAWKTTENGSPAISVVVAGDDPDPLDQDGALMTNLKLAMQNYGNRYITVNPQPHTKLLILLGCSITMYRDFTWAVVQQAISNTLFYNFGYAGQDLGESVYQSDVAKLIQLVPGVQYVKVDTFTSISGEVPASLGELAKRVTDAMKDAKQPVPVITVPPGAIAYLAADVKATLVIQQLTPSPFTANSRGVS